MQVYYTKHQRYKYKQTVNQDLNTRAQSRAGRVWSHEPRQVRHKTDKTIEQKNVND